MKKIISVLTTCMLTLSTVSSNAQNYFTQTISESVNNAIKYEQRNIITENGWIRAYIAYIDITNPNASIRVLTSSKGSSYLSTVKQMAEDNNAAIAINGDFFNFSSGQTNMLGMTYSNGEMISSPALDNMVSFVLTDNNEVIMDYFSHSSTVTSPQGYTCPVYQINKMPVNTGAITMLTSKWASHTPGKGYKAMIVENDTVTGFKQAYEDAASMPASGYVLVTNPEVNGFFDNFAVGDNVTVETVLTPNVQNIKEATGGNTLIVDNGRVCSFTSNITGYAQRSSVGISADGKTLILAATDGRQTDCRGLTQTELANLMIELGAHKAINLDGGGSTTFVKKEADGSYQIKNSLSSQRSVSTSIGVFDNGLKGEKIVRGEIKPSSPVLLEGDSVSMDIIFYDEYDNAVLYNSPEIILTDESGNPINRESYSPSEGIHTLYARYGDVSCSYDIEAVSNLFGIEASCDTAELKMGESMQIEVHGYDYFGRKFKINPALLKWSSSNFAISVQNGKITANSHDSAIVEVRYNDITDYINVNKSLSRVKAPASAYGTDALYGSLPSGSKIAISGNIPAGATLLNRYYSAARLRSLKSYSKAYITASYYADTLDAHCTVADRYTAAEFDKTVFTTLNNSDKYIKTSSDWSSIAIALATPYPNVVVTAELDPDQMLYSDRILLKSMLETSARGMRNVFFVCSGETSSVKTENGVRYITCGTVADYKTSAREENAKAAPYVVFYAEGDNIRYEFVQD